MGIDFSEVANIRFKCIEQCGKCCFYQAPALTTAEINRVIAHLKTKPREESEKFAIDCLTFLGRIPQLTKKLLNSYMDSLMWFWSPFQLEEAEKGILVRNYTIHSMPSSGRCKLLNPIDMTCFAYPARPDTCRLYPFSEKKNRNGVTRIFLAMKNCPGIQKGSSNLDKREITRIVEEGPRKMRKDVMAYEKYIADNNIKRVPTRSDKPTPKTYKEVEQAIHDWERSWREGYFFGKTSGKFARLLDEGKRFIEPLAESGAIPKHPLLALANEALEQTS